MLMIIAPSVSTVLFFPLSTLKGAYQTRSTPCTSTNQKGETLGSELFLAEFGIIPDLIAAVGKDGTEGYVRALELNVPSASSPDEVTTYNASLSVQRTIPLYASDGETVLGDFLVQNHIVFFE